MVDFAIKNQANYLEFQTILKPISFGANMVSLSFFVKALV